MASITTAAIIPFQDSESSQGALMARKEHRMIASRSAHGLYRLLAVAALSSSVTACNFPIRATSTEREEREPLPPTATVAPTDTRILPPSVTTAATDTVTPTVSPTATEGPPIFTTTVNANCRTGPGTIYDVVRILPTGTTEEIVGKDVSEIWWVVEDGPRCWISTATGTVNGDTSDVPVFPAPPTPTTAPTPTFTITPSPTLEIFLPPPRTRITLPPLVTTVTVTADETSYTGPCPHRFYWHATASATGALTANWIWETSWDGVEWAETASYGSITFPGAGSQPVHDYWYETTWDSTKYMRLHITTPNSVYSNAVRVTIDCTP
jgi:hypothetical protein